jgi:hypothetical protein
VPRAWDGAAARAISARDGLCGQLLNRNLGYADEEHAFIGLSE